MERLWESSTNWSGVVKMGRAIYVFWYKLEHTFAVRHQPGYQENYYFIHKKTIIFGLNIVGGRVHDEDEWFLRLTAEIDWVKSIVETNVPRHASGIIIMAHANPKEKHSPFFDGLKSFIRDDLGDRVPVLYLHGDGHSYFYRNLFLDQPNALQIQHEGGVRDPVLKILVLILVLCDKM